MSSNERENIRKEKQHRRDIHTKRVIWTVLIITLAALFIMKVCEINFATLRETVLSSFGISNTTENAYPYSNDSLYIKDMKVVNDKICLIGDNCLSFLEPSNADQIYSIDHNYTNPISFFSGNYICTIDQGGTRFRLDSTTDEKYEKNTTKRIVTADVTKSGYVAYVTLSDNAKSAVTIIDKSTNKKFEYNVKEGYVTKIAINPSGNNLCFVTVNTEEAKLVSTVHIMKIGDDKPRNSFKVNASNILDIKYANSGNCYIVCDDSLYMISSQKKIEEVFKQGSVSVIQYAYTDSNELVINYSDYSDSKESKISYIKSNGKIRTEIPLKSKCKCITTKSNKITVLSDENIVVYSLTGNEKENYSCSADISKAYSLSSKQFVLDGQFVEVVE